MSGRRITFSLDAGMSSENGREIRARAWAFVFECWRAKQEGGPAAAPDDTKVAHKERRSAWSDEKRNHGTRTSGSRTKQKSGRKPK